MSPVDPQVNKAAGVGENLVGLIHLNQIERRQWWLWICAAVIALLLTLGLASLAVSLPHSEEQVFFLSSVPEAVYGLLGLVLLFDIYVAYQQLQIHRMHLLLNREQEVFRLIGENAGDMIALVHANGRRLYNSLSYQTILGYSAHELASTGSLEQVHPDDRHFVSEAASEALRTGVGRKLEYRIRHKDGTWRIVESTATAIVNAKGKSEQLVIVNRDITERKKTEKILRETQTRQVQKMEAVGRLSGGIAHDFNNLLGVIIGYSEILETGIHQSDPMHKKVQEIKKAGERAASLTRQLLAFSRQQVLEPRVLDLNAVVRDVENLLRRLIGEDIELATTLHPTVGHVLGDQGQIEQVMMNLAANARDSMPRGGRLTIETTNLELDEAFIRDTPYVQPGRYVQLSFTDTGVGIDAETQTHIFEPFFTTKERGSGTGLGLATVYGVVKQSNGYIWVHSSPGKGTTFQICLPLVERPVQAASPETHQSRSWHGGETILLVEDEESLRTVTRDMLVQTGYEVFEANCGVQGLETAQRHHGPIHLLLTDVVMPGMSGPEMAKKLVSSHPEMKILYISGYTNYAPNWPDMIQSGVELLVKPYTREGLISRVRSVLDSDKIENLSRPLCTTNSKPNTDT